MIVNVDGTIKAVAASVAGKCGCHTHLTDTISGLFVDQFRKEQFVDIVNKTYQLHDDKQIAVNKLLEFSTLQDFSHYVATLLV